MLSLGKSGFETTGETLRESRVRDRVRMALKFQNKTIRWGAKYLDPEQRQWDVPLSCRRPPLTQPSAIHGKKLDVDPLGNIEPGTEKSYQSALDCWARGMEHLKLLPTHGLRPGNELSEIHTFFAFLQYYVAAAQGRLAGEVVTLYTAKGFQPFTRA